MTLLSEEQLTKEKCRNCKKRPAAVNWAGEGGSLAISHGWTVPWCEICSLKEQIAYKKKNLPTTLEELETQLTALEAEDA